MTLQIVCKPGHGRARDDKGPKSVNKKQCNTIKQRNVGRNHLFNQTVGVRGKMNSRETLHFTIEREREKCRSHLHTRADKQLPRLVLPRSTPFLPFHVHSLAPLKPQSNAGHGHAHTADGSLLERSHGTMYCLADTLITDTPCTTGDLWAPTSKLVVFDVVEAEPVQSLLHPSKHVLHFFCCAQMKQRVSSQKARGGGEIVVWEGGMQQRQRVSV